MSNVIDWVRRTARYAACGFASAALLALVAATTAKSTSADADAPESGGPNLIYNAGFETGASGDGPRGWLNHAVAPEYVNTAVAGKEGADTHSGARAVRLSRPDDYHDRWAATNDARVRVEPGKRYLFAVWVRTRDFANREFVQLRFEQYDAGGKLVRPEPDPYLAGPRERPEPGKWVEIRHEVAVGPETRLVRPLLVLSSGGNLDSIATATFDDVALVKLGD